MALPAHIAGLLEKGAYPHPCGDIELIETHISWVLLTGDLAYKLKKPVRFPFVDFSTLERRAHFCREELRCNRTFAPALYLDVVPVVRTDDGRICMAGTGEVVEWAVQMRQFPAAAQLDRLLESDRVEPDMLVEFGRSLAARHRDLPPLHAAAAEVETRVLEPIWANFADVLSLDWVRPQRASIERVRRLTEGQVAGHRALLARRLEQGCTRECHGDLHLSNLVLLEGRVTAFDCLEFNPDLRWIDPQSDVAFLLMDCLVRGRADLAYAFLDGYLDESGDYRGATLLPLYAAYRSMVRAKVAALRREQAGEGERTAIEQRFLQHLRWAEDWLGRPVGRLILMCGLSGSGKSFVAARLAPLLPAVRLRSDTARKAGARKAGARKAGARKAGANARESATDSAGSAVGAGLYRPERVRAVYDELRSIAADLLSSGENVIVDAAFLTAQAREPFLALAAGLGRSAVILYCDAPLEVLRRRVVARSTAGQDPSDADLAVLEHQRLGFRPPMASTLRVDTSDERLPEQLPELRRRLLGGG